MVVRIGVQESVLQGRERLALKNGCRCCPKFWRRPWVGIFLEVRLSSTNKTI